MKIQQRIEDLLHSGLNQNDLAELAGCSQSTISHLYRGRRGGPRKELADRLARLHKSLVAPKSGDQGAAA